MLLDYGNTKVSNQWQVQESKSPGYSRVYLVYRGAVTYEDAHQRKELNKGFLYIFPSSQPHKMTQRQRDPLICTYLHIDIFPHAVDRLIEIDLTEHTVLLHLFKAMRDCIDGQEREMVKDLNDLFERYCRTRGIIKPLPPMIESLLEYIRGHYNENLTNERLSDYLGYNGQYFIRMFKKQVGMTPHQYLINYRIIEAKAKMKSGKTLTAIAEETGFYDVKSFSRTFRQKTGMAPGSFREAMERLP